MLKKIINLFGKKKKKSSFRESKVKGDVKKNIVVPFFRSLKKEKKIETIETESQRIDKIAVEITDNFQLIARKSFLDMGRCYYIFLFRTLQSMIWSLSYPVYRHYFDSVRKQIVRNHKQLCHSFKEWRSSPSEQNLPGEKKKDEENDTVH